MSFNLFFSKYQSKTNFTTFKCDTRKLLEIVYWAKKAFFAIVPEGGNPCRKLMANHPWLHKCAIKKAEVHKVLQPGT